MLFFFTILTPGSTVAAITATKDNTITTIYPTKFYNTDGTTPIKHIFANGNEIGTVTGTGAQAVPRYVHSDNLNSPSVITNSSGAKDETLDYFPFGNIRIDSGSYSDQRKYIDQIHDDDTGLDYLNARYYDSSQGRFISQDPMFWQLTPEILIDPEQQNSYSYGRNNPVTLSDPEGKQVAEIALLAAILGAGIFSKPQITYAPTEIYNNYQRSDKTILSIPLRDNNINSQSGKIIGDIYSFVENQGITMNNKNHSVNSLGSTSLDGVKQDTVLGAIDFKQQCLGCSVVITGGTEIGPEPLKPIHSQGHIDGSKLDFGLNNKINNFIQNNYSQGSNRIDKDGSSNPRYYDSGRNTYVNEIGKSHWDVLFNQPYLYSGYTIK